VSIFKLTSYTFGGLSEVFIFGVSKVQCLDIVMVLVIDIYRQGSMKVLVKRLLTFDFILQIALSDYHYFILSFQQLELITLQHSH